MRDTHAFAPLTAPNFRRLWVSVAAAGSGKWALMMGLGWLVQVRTHSSFWVGVSVFAQMAPSLLVAPVIGVLADKFERRVLLAISLLLGGTAAASLAALSFSPAGNIGLIIGAALLFGVASTMTSTTANSLLPNVITRDDLLSGVAIQGAADRGSEWLGPVLASPLLVRFGPGAVFVLSLAFHLAAAAATLRIRLRPGSNRTEKNAAMDGSAQPTSVRDGLGYVRDNPLLGALLLMVALHCGLTMSFMSLLPSLASEALHSGSQTYGSLMSAIGLGAVAGSLAVLGVRGDRARGGLYLLTALLSGMTLAALGLSPTLNIALGSAFGMGVSQTIFMTLSLTYIQSLVADHFRGRITSFYLFLAMGVMSLANWGYGALGTVYGPRLVLLAVGSLFAVVTLALALANGSLRQITRGISLA